MFARGCDNIQFLPWISKWMSIQVICNAVTVAIAFFVVRFFIGRFSANAALLVFLCTLLAAVSGGIFVYFTQLFTSRPALYCLLLAGASSTYILLYLYALLYSGLLLGYVNRETFSGLAVYPVFGALVIFVILWIGFRKRILARQSSTS